MGIVSALGAEARHLGPTAQLGSGLESPADGALLVISGMGSAAAALAARALVDAGVTALAGWGMAGALDPALRAGTVLLPSQVISREGAVFPTSRYWRQRLMPAIAAHCPVTCGKLLTSPRAIGSTAEKAAAFRETGAAAVDMESLAVAEVAKAHGLPFIVVRAIVDTAADALPRAVTEAANSAGQLQIWSLIGKLARAPGDLASLVRLTRRYRAANRSLAAVGRAGGVVPHAFPIEPDP